MLCLISSAPTTPRPGPHVCRQVLLSCASWPTRLLQNLPSRSRFFTFYWVLQSSLIWPFCCSNTQGWVLRLSPVRYATQPQVLHVPASDRRYCLAKPRLPMWAGVLTSYRQALWFLLSRPLCLSSLTYLKVPWPSLWKLPEVVPLLSNMTSAIPTPLHPQTLSLANLQLPCLGAGVDVQAQSFLPSPQSLYLYLKLDTHTCTRTHNSASILVS